MKNSPFLKNPTPFFVWQVWHLGPAELQLDWFGYDSADTHKETKCSGVRSLAVTSLWGSGADRPLLKSEKWWIQAPGPAEWWLRDGVYYPSHQPCSRSPQPFFPLPLPQPADPERISMQYKWESLYLSQPLSPPPPSKLREPSLLFSSGGYKALRVRGETEAHTVTEAGWGAGDRHE